MSRSIAASCPFHPPALEKRAAGSLPLRIAIFVYGAVCYASFVAALGYAIGFVGNWLVPKTIDSGAVGPLWPALLVNGAFLAAFALQHTIMARPGFKRVWTRIIPPAAERSTFVLIASAILLCMYWQWRPLPQVVWQVGHPALVRGLSLLSLAGWGIVLLASFMVSHFELFGLRQSWHAFMGRVPRPVGFRLVGLYKVIRHPLMLGFLIAFWATPVMTVGHLFFAAMTTAYIFVGLQFEERDLVLEHGEDYLRYRRSVPGLIPRPWARGPVA